MSQFEYLAIAFSLLYSLAALRIIGGWSKASRSETRSPRLLGLCLVHLFVVAVSFWVFFSLQEADWTFIGFLVALLIPGTLYFCATVLIPDEPDEVGSWEQHYLDGRNAYFVGTAVWGLSAAASATINLGMGVVHPARVIHLTALLIGIVGGVSRSDRVHTGLIVFMLVVCVAVTVGQVPTLFLTAEGWDLTGPG